MADDLAKLWENLSLSKGEGLEFDVEDQDLTGIVRRGKDCLVEKLVANRIVSKENIRSTLIRGWRHPGTLSFKILGENLFLIEFEHVWDRERESWREGRGCSKEVCSQWKFLMESQHHQKLS